MSNRQRHFIPTNAAQFNLYMRNIINFVAQRTGGTPPDWDNIPQARFQALNQQYELFNAALVTAQETPTHGNVLTQRHKD